MTGGLYLRRLGLAYKPSPTDRICDDCRGSGIAIGGWSDSEIEHETCGGTGYVPSEDDDADHFSDHARHQMLATFPTLEAYWRDPAPFDAEREAGQARIDALFAGHDLRIREQQEARWAREEQGNV